MEKTMILNKQEKKVAKITAFREALEIAAKSKPDVLQQLEWRNELKYFPKGCCSLASNFLGRYLIDAELGLHPFILQIDANESFRTATDSSIHAHSIISLDGEYIDITLDQFREHDNRISIEPIECGGKLSQLLKNVLRYGGTISTRAINIKSRYEDGEELYSWLRETANSKLPPNYHENSCNSLANLVSLKIPQAFITGK